MTTTQRNDPAKAKYMRNLGDMRKRNVSDAVYESFFPLQANIGR